MKRARAGVRLLTLLLGGLASAGCVHQRLIVRSEPPGAELILNDKRMGTTPYDQPFLWYGSYRLTLMKPGYEQLDDRAMVRAPVYLWIPLDLVMEVLPFPVRHTKVLTYTLTPKTALPEPIAPWSAAPAREQTQKP